MRRIAGAGARTREAGLRGVFSDKVRAGMILRIDQRYFRVLANARSQKGQNAASYNLKLTEVGTNRPKDVTAGQGHDFPEVKSERVRLLFSGFDDDDFACFVFPEHHAEAGREINVPGDSLPELQQKFLCTRMPVDMLHVIPDDDTTNEAAAAAAAAGGSSSKDIWAEVVMPTSYIYTVEKISLKGLYKMAALVECDGVVSVNDSVQIGEKIKVTMRQDGTAAFAGKAAP